MQPPRIARGRLPGLGVTHLARVALVRSTHGRRGGRREFRPWTGRCAETLIVASTRRSRTETGTSSPPPRL
jgi:hypothetical protein